ncbi:chitinase-3-like protein 1 [Frieseomelitta varia]|uniref:chitinase-3-like protein 1 n=1 Tax=Frieseomelitta varia TaxID=561572 RepID=UPI001CB695D8|nr:chitinase-3-like protein 1 [Frieseomelitta varia]XP_043526630.1 chitinase-3-like protein 1 [Frieseomelitta varia]
MSKTVFLFVFLSFVISITNADKRIVCYYGSWAAYRRGLGQFEATDIDPTLCTHIIYTFIGISQDGNVKILDSWLDLPNGRDGYGKFTRLRERSPETKALIAIGGWNEGSQTFSEVAANADIRAQFVQNVITFLKEYNFDGFDVDWEYPNQRGGKPADKENFVILMKELREEFNKHGYILSVAVGAAETSASKSYLISEMSQYPHFINLMTYDFHGSWDNFAAINAPLYASSRESGDEVKLNVNSAVKYWLEQGAPANKLVVGIPAYGRSFTLSNPSYNTVGSSTNGPGRPGPYTQESGMLGYNEICEYVKQGWTVRREPEQHVPYAFKDNQWVGYDDTISVEEKTKYAMSMGLGGMMIWSVETDDFRGTCGEKYPLLLTINRVLRGYNPPLTSTTTKPNTSAATTTKPSTTTPSSSSSSSPIFVCTHEGYVRDLKNCSIFYYCQKVNDKYVANKFYCPYSLVFDTTINGCNYKYNVPGC